MMLAEKTKHNFDYLGVLLSENEMGEIVPMIQSELIKGDDVHIKFKEIKIHIVYTKIPYPEPPLKLYRKVDEIWIIIRLNDKKLFIDNAKKCLENKSNSSLLRLKNNEE